MGESARRWHHWITPFAGVLVMAAGLAVLVFRHDGAAGYSLLGVGGTIFGISGLSPGRRRKSRVAC